jgi:hypothetical protein
MVQAGTHDLSLDLSALPNGVYVCSLSFYGVGATTSSNPIFMTKE